VTPENIVIVAGAAKESAACSAQGQRVQLDQLVVDAEFIWI